MNIIRKFQSIESFETERLRMVRLRSNDLDKLTLLYTHPEITATLGGMLSPDKIQARLDWNLQQWTEHHFGVWLIYLKEANEWIGRGGLRGVTIEDRQEVEIGYALLPQFWHRGLATEFAKACLEIAFEVLRLPNVVCFTLTTNKASQRVMEKAGFEYERDFIMTYEGNRYPHVLYRKQNYRKPIVVPYNQTWPEIFRNEAALIQSTLGSSAKEIYHIGSTAIPNMPAKPIIDMLLVCSNITSIEEIKNKLRTLGYMHISRQIIPHLSYIAIKTNEQITYHLHVYEQGDPQIKRHVHFRDYLIHHPAYAHTYAQLKSHLVKQPEQGMVQYVMGKTRMVQSIDKKAKLWEKRHKDFLPMIAKSIKELSKEAILKRMTANLNVQNTYYAQYIHSIRLIRVPGYTMINTGLSDDTFNLVLDADFSEDVAQQKIAEVTHYFKKWDTPFSWWLSPFDRPSSLGEILESNHYKNTESNIAMYFDLDGWKAPENSHSELNITQARDEKTLHDFALVLANDESTFKTYFSWIAGVLTDEDPIEYYVGYMNGKPVVRGLTCYYAGVAGFYWLSTALDERKKGYAKAMQVFQFKRAQALGYHLVVLNASNEGYPMYCAMGYRECGVFKEYKLQK